MTKEEAMKEYDLIPRPKIVLSSKEADGLTVWLVDDVYVGSQGPSLPNPLLPSYADRLARIFGVELERI